MDAMTPFIFAAAAMVVLTLFNGIVSMAHGGEHDLAHSHELMFKRVAWQALALLLLVVSIVSA